MKERLAYSGTPEGQNNTGTQNQLTFQKLLVDLSLTAHRARLTD